MLSNSRKLDTLLHSHQSDSRGGGDHPPPSHTWSGLLIADMFQDGLEEQITKAVVLASGRPSCSLKDDCTKRGSPIQVQGTCWVQLDRSS